MKMISLYLNGFRCWEKTTVFCESYTSLIGRNDSGKSALLRAIAFLFDPNRTWAPTDDCAFSENPGPNDFYVEATFADCHEGFPLSQEGTCRIRRYRNGAYETDGLVPANPFVAALLSGSSKSAFRDGVGEDSPLWTELSNDLKAKQRWSAADAKDAYAILEGLGLVETESGTGPVDPALVRNCFLPIFLDADARLGDVASGTTSVFAKLTDQVTENALRRDEQVREAFESLQKRVTELSQVDEEGVPEFKDLSEIQEDLSRLVGAFNPRVRAKVTPTPGTIPFPRVSSVLKIVDDWTDNMAQFGHGLQRTVIFALLQILAKQQGAKKDDQAWQPFTVLIVEEPELYLHPQAERARMQELEQFSELDDTTVVVATHSSFFIDILKYKGLKIIERAGGRASEIRQWDAKTDLAGDKKEELKLLKAFNPTAAAMFFADKIVLAEGETEEVSIPLVFERLGLSNNGVQVVDCGGASKIVAVQEVLEAFKKPYAAVFDWDKSKEQAKKGFEISETGVGSCTVLVENWETVAGLPKNDNKVLNSYQKFSDPKTVVPDELARAMNATHKLENYIPEITKLEKPMRKSSLDQTLELAGIMEECK